MALKRGDVVLVQYPYSSGTGSKLRPALVVQPDHNNQRLSNVILAAITTTTHRHGEPTQYLRHTSVVTCENVTTVEKTLVRRHLGRLPDAAMETVNNCLKAAMGLS